MGVTRKSFLLGLGAQKSGTSWLYWTLSQKAPGFRPGFAKEYHIWDVLNVPECAGMLQRFEGQAIQALRKGLEHWKTDQVVLRLPMYADPSLYFDYFTKLLTDEEALLAADISPEYAALDPEILTMIRETFACRGICVKPVFLLRDPVCRVASMCRMLRRFGGQKPDAVAELEQMKAMAGGPYDLIVADYGRTIANLDAAFGDGNYHLGVYETMFEPDQISRLGSFLGTDLAAADTRRRVHRDPQTGAYPEAEVEALAARYSRQYEDACSRLGPDILDLWKDARARLTSI